MRRQRSLYLVVVPVLGFSTLFSHNVAMAVSVVMVVVVVLAVVVTAVCLQARRCLKSAATRCSRRHRD
jgi:hypothetical protein